MPGPRRPLRRPNRSPPDAAVWTLYIVRIRRVLGAAAVLCAAVMPAQARAAEEREIEIDGRPIRYTVEAPAAERPGTETNTALATARRLHEHLARGEIEAAALLSNSPKRRFEIYRDYLESVGEASFRQVYSQYLDSSTKALAEIALGERRLIVWKLVGLAQSTGEFFIRIEDETYMDDVPSEDRKLLRRILETYRQQRGEGESGAGTRP